MCGSGDCHLKGIIGKSKVDEWMTRSRDVEEQLQYGKALRIDVKTTVNGVEEMRKGSGSPRRFEIISRH